jgi:hypothetical protein
LRDYWHVSRAEQTEKGAMSALGQKRTLHRLGVMHLNDEAAQGLTLNRLSDVCFVPKADSCTAAMIGDLG